ncbi:hypothetical protein [Vulgatibacter incomptus]|uniref:Uncharacterized protein n=1 Tax=Vulgatibacter incomptus TaxID=1391653 RepID=A0A0K1PEA9_9BACT|nr:hypothetical protein [Vulgatibacter incomptus]AKU91832.1 hypothetical protein AKJ08_2219 [Vulgatibacter incomptus]
MDRGPGALRHNRRAVTAIAALVAALLAACGGNGPKDPSVEASDRYEFRATDHGFESRKGDEPFRAFYSAGINFGLAVPGTLPGEFLATREQIARWIAATAELGLNTIRIYTVQSPEFYEELRRWNLEHPKMPLFLLQGAWLREPEDVPADYLGEYDRVWFRDELEKVVDVVYGNREILPGGPERPLNWGRAFGTYTADVSPWLLGWLIGREVEPQTLMTTYARHESERAYHGVYFTVEDGDPFEAYIAESFDYLVSHEELGYGRRHPIAFSNWPTLDPLDHYTEPPYPYSSEEMFSLDMKKVAVSPNFTEGVFISYHAYPYYPDFIVYQPDYQVSDAQGSNSYLGYLRDLRAYYEGYTVVISEIGLPSSQGSAKRIPSGLDHGGLDERQQGAGLLRALGSVVDSGMDGFAVFSIVDEWFKRAWIVDPIELPADRRHLWHNAMNPEQNFGLIALRPGSPERFHFVDGTDDGWTSEPRLRKDGGPAAPRGDGYDSMRTLRDLTIEHDEGYLHLLLRVDDLDPMRTGRLDWSKVSYWLAFDTVDPERGDGFLDPAKTIGVERRVEFLLRLDADGASLLVDRPYDLYGVWHGLRDESQAWRTVANDDGIFHPMRNLTNWEYVYEGEQLGPFVDDAIGTLPIGPESEKSDTSFWYSLDEGTLEVRIPWSLLYVTDPSQRRVVDDRGESRRELGTSVTPEIAVAAMSLSPAESPILVDAFGAIPTEDGWRIPASGFARYSWEGWDTVTFHEYRKASFGILKDGLPSLLGRVQPR